MRVENLRLPSLWALYLIYGDKDGLAPSEVKTIDKWFNDMFDIELTHGLTVECVDTKADGMPVTGHHDATDVWPLTCDTEIFTFHIGSLSEPANV